jgi:hypothetical protein
MARLSELVDTRKRSNFENEKRKKIKVDELGKYVRMESFELIGMHVTT